MSTQNVLCAVDISNDGRDAGVLKKAAQLAELEGAQLDVITVVPDFGMSIVGSYFDASHHEKAVEEAKQQLSDLIATVLGEDAAASVRHIVATGKTYEQILQAASGDKAGLIVIGAHKPGIDDFLLGTNASRVVRHSECSVYVVR